MTTLRQNQVWTIDEKSKPYFIEERHILVILGAADHEGYIPVLDGRGCREKVRYNTLLRCYNAD